MQVCYYHKSIENITFKVELTEHRLVHVFIAGIIFYGLEDVNVLS